MSQDPRAITVFTGNLWCPTEGDVAAIAVRDGQITATGAEALALLGDGVEDVVSDEGLLVPAFGDGHAHPLFGGLEGEGPRIGEQTDVAGIVDEVRRWADEHRDHDWILGASYNGALAPEGLFDARWLDEAVPDRPVVLRANDYHTVWVNSMALQAAGITADTPDPVLGQIPRRPDGSVLGTLREWGAIDLVDAVASPWPQEVMVRSLERAAHAYAAQGITWVQDAWVEPATLDVYLAAARADRLPIRFNLALYADPRRWPDQMADLLEARARVRDVAHPFLRADTVKFFADGVVENSTGALLDHYCGHPGDHGMLVWDPDELAKAVTDVDAAGFQPHIHAIGDRAVRVGLDAIETAVRANGPRDRRPVLAHVQLIDPADRARMAELGVVANLEPLWFQLDDSAEVLMAPRLGAERFAEQYPVETLRRLGVAVSFGSDWPVSSADPLDGIATACSRQTPDHVPAGGWMPQERLSVDDAFAGYTAGVAYQGFRDAGRFAVGSEADLVLLSADPRTLATPRDIDSVTVKATWVAGRPVYDIRA